MTEPLRYAVVLSDVAAFKPQALARALAPALGRPALDLVAGLRGCWGLIELDGAEAVARCAAQALSAAGLPALAVPRALVEEAPAAEPIRALPELAPIRLLAAAAVKVKTTRLVKVEERASAGERALRMGLSLATGIPLGVGKSKEVEKKIESSDLAYFLEVYVGEPARRLRVDAGDFDFSCLGERMGLDAGGNFRTLLACLAARAGRLNHGARGLLAGQPVRELGYESLEDLDREGSWLLTLEALQKV